MKLTGNTILITGGGSGIGRGLAESFHALGNEVIIAGRREQLLQETVAANPGMKYVPCDLDRAEAVAAFVDKLTGEHPGLNVLINNAGIQRLEDLTAGDVADAEAMITTNLLGPIRLTAALLPALSAQPDAAIMNVTSTLAFVPQAMTPTYCATKAAMHSYTQSLRFQLRDTAVRVIEIVPPWVQTDLQGVHGRNPAAMPLDEYVAETMSILGNTSDEDEIVVERGKAMRFAERDGYDSFYRRFNEGFVNRLSAAAKV